MSQFNKNYPCSLTKGCRTKDPNQKDVPYVGFAAEQIAAFPKPSVQWKKNPNRSYNDNPSRGNVGSNKLVK